MSEYTGEWILEINFPEHGKPIWRQHGKPSLYKLAMIRETLYKKTAKQQNVVVETRVTKVTGA